MFLGVICLALLVPFACAQVAIVSATTGKVEHRLPGKNKWQRSRVGTVLPPSSQVRTGRRSVAEIRLPDGTTYRLGPQSQLTIQAISPHQAALSRGGVFARVIKGSLVRIRGRYGTVAVRGTKVAFEIVGDREYVRVWEGGAEYQTPQGVIQLPGGTGTWAIEGGRPATAMNIAPDTFAGGEVVPWWENARSGVDIQTTTSSPVSETEQVERASQEEQVRETEPTRRERTGSIEVEIQQVGPMQGAAGGLNAGAGLLSLVGLAAHSQPAFVMDKRLGKKMWGPYGAVQVYGLWGEGGSFAGARARARAVINKTMLQVSGRLDAASGDDLDVTLDETFLAWKGESWSVVAGRSRILEGPVNNSDFGTLMPFSLVDGLRVTVQPTSRTSVTLAWLQDYENIFREDRDGFYAQADTYLLGGNVGVVAVKDEHAGTGVACQFSLPLVRDYVEVYGEIGDDPMGCHLETFGLYLPELYQRTGLDLYLERAQRRGYDTLTSLHAYWEYADGKSMVGIVQHSRRQGWRFGVGFIANFTGL